MASMPPIHHKREAAKSQPNLLDQIGKAWNDLMHGKAGKAVKPAPPRPKEIKKPEAPRSPEKKAPPVQPEQRRPSNVAPRMCLPSDAPPQVIHRFDSAKFQKSESFGGLVKNRDRTHQVVQKQDKNGNWEVSVQPVNEGRVNPNQKAFLSKRRVSVADFNNRDSALFKSTVAATRRLNADSNRLPEPAKAPDKKPAKQAEQAPQNLGDWSKQQLKNAVGGASSAFTSTVGMVGSLPEHTVKAASGLVDGVKISANIISGGRIAPSALNPMVMDEKDKQYNSRTVVSQGTDRLQAKIDRTIGSDKNSFTYKATEFVAPLLVPTKGAKAGKPGGGGNPGGVPAPVVKPPSPAPLPTMVKAPGANNIVPFARNGTPLGKPTGTGTTGTGPVGGTPGGGSAGAGVRGSGGTGGTGGTGAVPRPGGGNRNNGGSVATLEAPARLTSAPPPVVAELGAGLPRPVVNQAGQPVQPQLLKPAAPLGMGPGGAAPTLAPSALKPQPNPFGLPGLVKPDTAARPTGDPASPFPQTIPSPADPATNPKRRVPGDLPAKPGGGIERSPEEQKKFDKWMDKHGDVLRQQQIKDYSAGRTTREEVLNGRAGKDLEHMSNAIDQIDRGRVGPGRTGAGASGGNRSTAEVKDIWRQVDAKGGIDAMPERTVRQLQGITEQGLKDANLTPAERGELTKRLEGAIQAQGQYHKAREADKNHPPVDTSGWNLPSRGAVFGSQGTTQNASTMGPAANPATGSATDPALGSQIQPGTSTAESQGPGQATPIFEGLNEANRYESLTNSLVRTKDGLAVRVNSLSENQKTEYDRLIGSGLNSANINEIINLLAISGVDSLANKYPDLSADNLASISILKFGLGGAATVHDLTHVLAGDPNKIPFDVSEFGEASGHALINAFIGDPRGIYNGFSVSTGADGQPVLSSPPLSVKTAIHEFDGSISKETRLANDFRWNFLANSTGRVRKALSAISLDGGAGPKEWPAQFDSFYQSLVDSGQLPKKYDDALANTLRTMVQRYITDTRSNRGVEAKEKVASRSLTEISFALAERALKEFTALPRDSQRQFYIDGIASVLAIHHASPVEVEKPLDSDEGRFSSQWTGLKTSGSALLTKPGFLKDYLEIRRQLRKAFEPGKY